MSPLSIARVKLFSVLSSIVFTFSFQAQAQLTVTPNQTAAVLSSALAGPGITIAAPVLTCSGQANGRFTVSPGTIMGTGPATFGIASGIVLTTGKSIAAAGLESTLASTNNGTAGDPTLTTLAGAATYDACILEFDVTVTGDTLRFNYQMGSEEYNHSTCGPYNDAFAFFISGPGIVGTQNMALVPGTTIPVTVNSVNSGVPGTGYTLANCTAMGPGSPFPAYFVDNTGGTNFTYKGFTTKLTAWHTVTPCGTYHLKLTIADAGNSIYDSGVFIEAGSLTTPVITGISSLCVGGTATLSYAGTGGTWSSGSPAVATVGATTGVVTGVSAGVATISYTLPGGCFATTTVTVGPSAPITGTTAVCVGGTTTLSDATPGGTWTSTTTSVATIGATTGIVTGVSAGTSVITYTSPAGCVSTTTVTVNPAPAPIIGTLSLCAGSTTLLSDLSGGGTWTSSNPAVATVGVTGLVSGIAAGTATIDYTLATGCFTSTVVTVNPLPLAIAGTGTVCAGGTITLTDLTAGGTWTSGTTSVATINPASGLLTGLTGGTTLITYTLATGCYVTRTITVNPTPAPITGAGMVCIGATAGLSDATPGGIWTSATTSVATVGASTGIVTGMASGTTVITYALGTGCFSVTTVTVNTVNLNTVNAAICNGSTYVFAGSTYSATGSYVHTFHTTYCDSVVTLNLTVNAQSSTVLNDSICQGQSYTLGGNTYTASGTYTYVTPNVYGCDSAVTLNLYVKSAPPVPSVVSPVSYCQYQQAVALIAYGQNLLWYTVSSGGTGSSFPPVPPTTAPGSTLYYVSQTVNGCSSQLAAIQVDVTPKPDATILPSRTTLCSKDTLTLSAALQPSVSYSWSLPELTGIESGSAASPGPITVRFDSSGAYYVTLTVTGNGGSCSSTDSVLVHVLIAPAITLYTKPEVCVGDTVVVSLTSVTPGITSFVWNFGDATVLTATDQVIGGPYKVTWHTPGVHYISSYGTIMGQCHSKNMIDSIDVVALPAPKIMATVDNVCEGDSVLFATAYVPENLYTWTPGHYFQNANTASIYGRILKATSVLVTETTPIGCRGEDSVYVNAQSCCNVLFPNAFTPNGFEPNNVFRPVNNGHHLFHVFRIFNRWGQTVFETSNSRDGWDGKFNGVPQDMDVYYYYVKYDCNGKTIEARGDVTLIR